jgi:hypothetical protein
MAIRQYFQGDRNRHGGRQPLPLGRSFLLVGSVGDWAMEVRSDGLAAAGLSAAAQPGAADPILAAYDEISIFGELILRQEAWIWL